MTGKSQTRHMRGSTWRMIASGSAGIDAILLSMSDLQNMPTICLTMQTFLDLVAEHFEKRATLSDNAILHLEGNRSMRHCDTTTVIASTRCPVCHAWYVSRPSTTPKNVVARFVNCVCRIEPPCNHCMTVIALQ
jgi:hypothetical protein